jgi:HD superfamily phosphohydrolase
MASRLEIRDPIHGFIHRESHEQEIIDTPVFQRLRKIKQLALANLVYPGALHTRFDHSIGAFHIASKVASKLLDNENERRVVRMAALLHDVGHGPFSHVSEDVFAKFCKRDALGLKEGEQIHEVIGRQIICSDPCLGRLISERDRENIVGLLRGTWGETILKAIISGPLDVDKQDYLLRDSYFCGVKYGVYDLERLIETLRAHDDGDDRYLVLSHDGIHALEQFVLAKYYMTTQVYHHRIRLISDEMIIRGLSLGISEDNLDWLKYLYSYDGSQDFVKEYLTWNDERLATRILDKSTPDGYAKQFFERLAERRLFKRIFSAGPADFKDPQIRGAAFEGKREFLELLEQNIASKYGFEVKMVVAKLVKEKSVRKHTTSTEGQVIVLHPNGPRMFHEESALFRSINDAISEQVLEVYAPVIYQDDKDKRKKRREYFTEIVSIVEEIANPQSRLFDGNKQPGDKK